MQRSDQITLFVLGFGIGAATAVLLAPESGARTRGRIQGAVNNAGDFIRRTTHDAADAAKHVTDEAIAKVKDIAHMGKKMQSDAEQHLQDA